MKTPPPDFQKIAAAALGCFDQIMGLLALSGKRQGPEFLPLNPRRADSKRGSFSINSESGAWADFAADVKGGDLISLAAYIRGGSNTDAAVWLAEVLNIPGGSVPIPAAPRAKAQGAAEWLAPVPFDAPRTPAANMRHGKPSQVWTYRAADGRAMFYHCRFDPRDQRKQFAPLTLWRDQSGRIAWAWKWPPVGAPVPLYNLPRLVELPAAPVIITEGEKAADAAALLFPNHPVCTWAGGSNAVGKADITPLAGRECWLWPDNDEPGRKAMETLAARLSETGAETVKRFNLGALNKRPGTDASEPLETGDDAADLLARGWAADHFRQLIESGELLEIIAGNSAKQPPAASAQPRNDANESERQSKFEMRPKGLWRQSEKGWFPVCPPFEVLAEGRDPESAGWGLLISLHDPDGRPHYVTVPYRVLRGDGAAALELFMDRGMVPHIGCDKFLVEFLRETKTEKRARWVNRPGWHGDPAAGVYVTENQTYGAKPGELWLLESDGPRTNPFKTRGSLDDWRQNVAALCVNNSRLIFAISNAFAAPLLYPLEVENGGFSLVGKSSGGKTTILKVGASTCGAPASLERLRATDNGLESIFMSKCDSAAFLDELGQLGPQIAGEAIYMAANGSQKARASRTGGSRERASWRTLFLLSSEISLAAHMGEGGRAPKAGQQTRLAEIPADAGADFGAFEDLHQYASAHEFAQAITRAAATYYGTAFAAFLEGLMQERGERLWHKLREDIRQFERDYLKDANAGGQASRVAARFGLVAAAGELAIQWLELPWKTGAANEAAGKLFSAWLVARGGAGDQEERAMLAQVRDFLSRHAEARFTDWDRPAADTDKHAPRVINRAGFRRVTYETSGRPTEDQETEYLIFPEVWRGEVCKGHDPAVVARILAKRGALHATDDGRLARSLTLPGEGKRRVYHVLPTIWAGEQ